MRRIILAAGFTITLAGPCLGQDPDPKRISILEDLISTLGPASAAYTEAMQCAHRLDHQRFWLDARAVAIRAMGLFDSTARETILRMQTGASGRYLDMPQPLRCDRATNEAVSFLARVQELLTALRANLEAPHD